MSGDGSESVMRVNNNGYSSQINKNQLPTEIKKGDVLTVSLKEVFPNQQQALVSFKGRDLKVQFEGNLPEGQRIGIQVKSIEGDVIKAIQVPIDAKDSVNQEAKLS